MTILIRDPEIDQNIRQLASQLGCTLQEAVGRAVKAERERIATRRQHVEEATRRAQAYLQKHGRRVDDGLTHKEFFDREYCDA